MLEVHTRIISLPFYRFRPIRLKSSILCYKILFDSLISRISPILFNVKLCTTEGSHFYKRCIVWRTVVEHLLCLSKLKSMPLNWVNIHVFCLVWGFHYVIISIQSNRFVICYNRTSTLHGSICQLLRSQF